MSPSTARKTVAFISGVVRATGQTQTSITFHGGEPLLASIEVWTVLLESLAEQLIGVKVRTNVQTNLLAMDDAFAALFRKFGVSVGTSIDGPLEICDRVRGDGYWEQNQRGLAKAREHGLSVGGIATVSRETLGDFRRVAEFYVEQNLDMNLHPALGSLDHPDSPHALSPTENAGLMREAVQLCREKPKTIGVSTVEHYCHGLINGDPQVCTFKDCLGMFLALDPNGLIYPCQRFCGRPEFSFGNIGDQPAIPRLLASPMAQRMLDRQAQVSQRCAFCDHVSLCRGGCFYNAVATGDGIVDPLCAAYRSTFDNVRKLLLDEAASPENLDAIAAHPPAAGEHPLFRKGPLISLAQHPHPRRVAANARGILSIHALAKFNDPVQAARDVVHRHICGDLQRTEQVMRQHGERLRHPQTSLNNLYVHVTFACNLRCNHCYAQAGDANRSMDPRAFHRLLGDARKAGFRQLIITGGEPLVHPSFNPILEHSRAARGLGMNLVLRTNLAGALPDPLLLALAGAFDQVVASVDGDATTHDQRRGPGVYAQVTQNMERYQALCAKLPKSGELSLACCMDAASIQGAPGHSVRDLATLLGIKRIRFRPLLPLGRAASMSEPVMCEGLHAHLTPDEMLKADFQPLFSCGIGQNLYVEPDGHSFPCYAYHRPHTWLGNIFAQGLAYVLASDGFRALSRCTVDTMQKCRECEIRYLCGGACRAWGNEANQRDLNAPPPNCEHLQSRGRALLAAAEAYLRT